MRGIALANAVEQAASPVPEYAEIRFQPSGSVIMLLGTKTHGQVYETSFKQILHEKIGIDPAEGPPPNWGSSGNGGRRERVVGWMESLSILKTETSVVDRAPDLKQ